MVRKESGRVVVAGAAVANAAEADPVAEEQLAADAGEQPAAHKADEERALRDGRQTWAADISSLAVASPFTTKNHSFALCDTSSRHRGLAIPSSRRLGAAWRGCDFAGRQGLKLKRQKS